MFVKALALTTASMALVQVQVQAQTQPDAIGDTIYFTGFLTDMLCARLEIAPDTANMIINPIEHTVRCELLPACLRSGYGLSQNIGTDGDPLYRVSAVFDEPTNDYVVDMFNTMDPMTADLRVQIRGTVLNPSTPTTLTPEIVSSDGERSWPAMNDVPTITVDDLQFCNYQGPDAKPIHQADNVCLSTSALLDSLAAGGDNDSTIANANLCMDQDISLTSEQDGHYLLTPTGCADHATFQDVKRADPATCSQTTTEECEECKPEQDSCASECTDVCGNPLVMANGATASLCCFDACGNPYIDACGFPLLDACGNPITDTGAACPATSIGENQVNECLDVCGNPIVDACGNPVDQCCLDGCGNPILDPCGFPFLDPCGNPAMDAAGLVCANLGANVCLPDSSGECQQGGQCELACLDVCGNPIVLASGLTATSCCLDACGNPILDACGFPTYDACGNPTNATGDLCTNVAENQVNQCIDVCGNPLADACGNPYEHCCVDACGNPILDPCGFPWTDPCGNPLVAMNGALCPDNQLGSNTCEGGGGADYCMTDCVDACGNPFADACGNPLNCCTDACGNPITDPCGNPFLDPCGNPLLADGGALCPADQVAQNTCTSGGGASWRKLVDAISSSSTTTSTTKKGYRRTLMANHEKIVKSKMITKKHNYNRHLQATCQDDCVDACGNPLPIDISGRPATTCCLDGCGNPIVDACGFPFYDACGNPQDGYTLNLCMADNIGQSDRNLCIDACGNPLSDACGNPLEVCCLDGCGNPLVDACGNPLVDPCGNPASDASGTACAVQDIGENACLSAFQEGGTCEVGCFDVCGNPLVVASGRTATTCCVDPCGNPFIDACGFPLLDPCGNPTAADGSACPSAQIASNQVTECIDGCGSPLVDACGNPVDACCLDVCGNPLVDPCGFPWLDPCGNPALNAAGDLCPNPDLGVNTCFPGQSPICEPALLLPPASDSFQCTGLVSVCTLATQFPAAATANPNDGVPESVAISRRATRRLRRMQGEPSVPRYTPIKKDLRFKIPRTPTSMRVRKDLDPQHDGVIGVAVNGVPIVYEHPDENANTMLFDSCGGHGDLANRYHYHLPPICLLRSLGGTVPRVSDWWLAPNAETQWPGQSDPRANASPLIGWALDGHPIFGPYNPDNGELVVPSGASGDEECAENVLDECNGMVLENGVYAYFLTPTAPFVPPCLMGDVAEDAFSDNGALNGAVEACPFEGTNPLAGTEICDEKTIIFQDESCPGNADRQDIRHCFELATSSFVGEPTCEQMETAIQVSMECFTSPGCCIDLEETLSAWVGEYPALEQCTFPETGCIVFGEDNVIDITVNFGIGVQDMVPDTQAAIRKAMAASLAVDPSRVLVDRVSGTDTNSTILFNVAYPTREEAADAAASLDEEALRGGLGAFGTVESFSAEHALPRSIPTSDRWSTRQKSGFGISLAAVAILTALLVYFEDFNSHSSADDDEAVPKPSKDDFMDEANKKNAV